jgi:putative two-component system response regulator
MLPTLLIVDDEPSNLALLTEILRPHYHVRAATSGRRALDAARSEPQPQLILLDVMMPGMDGYEVIGELRADPVTRAIPVIFVTALNDDDNEARGLKLGAVDYIAKPLSAAIVLARVSAHLELKLVRDQLITQNTWLEAEVERRMAENTLSQDASILALGFLAETRDLETGNHIRRTQLYVYTLAVRLASHPRFASQMDEKRIQLLTKSAPLHDIGKVGIPDAVLLKPGPLSPEEWVIMKTHTTLGAEAIEKTEAALRQPVPFLAIAKEIAHWHHERWDGKGYPDGLAGDAIPLSARLMALADVYDALVSKRVYKQPYTTEEARRMIEKERGLHFDPDVVDAFLDTYDEFLAISRSIDLA